MSFKRWSTKRLSSNFERLLRHILLVLLHNRMWIWRTTDRLRTRLQSHMVFNRCSKYNTEIPFLPKTCIKNILERHLILRFFHKAHCAACAVTHSRVNSVRFSALKTTSSRQQAIKCFILSSSNGFRRALMEAYRSWEL